MCYVLRRHPAGVSRISPELALLLEEADRPRTLAEHANRITTKGLTAEDPSSVEAKYRQLADNGLLVPVDGALLAATPNAIAGDEEHQRPTTSPTTDSWIVWPTRNRPDLLERSILSWFERADHQAKSAIVLVCDDSDSADAEKTRLVCESAPEGASRIIYFGREGREELARFLVDNGVSEQSARFALFGDQEVGDPQNLNRNATMLLTVGSRFLSLDDDVIYRTARHPEFSSDVKFSSSSYPIDFKFFAGRSQLLESIVSTDDSFVGFLSDAAGVPFSDLLRSAMISGKVNLADLRSVDLDRLNSGVRVAVASFGSFGHSGMPSSHVILGLRHRLRETYQNDAEYLLSVESSEVLRVARNLTVGFVPTFMSMAFACDNSALLPPFFPMKRSMDGVWGISCALTDPNMAFAQLPIAVYHDPAYDRPHLRASAVEYRPRFAEYLRVLLLAWGASSVPDCPSDRLRRLGVYLQDLSELTSKQFQCYFRESWIDVVGSQIAQLESLVHDFQGVPGEWARDVESYVSSALAWGQQVDLPMPVDIDGEADVILRLLSRFGGTLLEWSKMRAIAREFDVSPYEV